MAELFSSYEKLRAKKIGVEYVIPADAIAECLSAEIVALGGAQ